ncbi:MAG: precorrin-2 dehydrogenase/sirohydrochlorin ferrochelatase family protein, partial [Burkholderiales bacterium]
MDFFPIFLNLKGKTCLVVGGGEVAVRKASVLLQSGAKVKVVSPGLCMELRKLEIEHLPERFSEAHLEGMTLAIAATDDRAVNVAVSEAARKRNIPVNVVDNPDLCSFVMPSILDRSPLIVAFSTGGASPVLARLL